MSQCSAILWWRGVGVGARVLNAKYRDEGEIKTNSQNFARASSALILSQPSGRLEPPCWHQIKNGLICTYSGLPGNHPPLAHSLKTLQMCEFHLMRIFFLRHITSPLCGFNGDERRSCTWAQLMLKIQALKLWRRPDIRRKRTDSIFFCFGALFLTTPMEKSAFP